MRGVSRRQDRLPPHALRPHVRVLALLAPYEDLSDLPQRHYGAQEDSFHVMGRKNVNIFKSFLPFLFFFLFLFECCDKSKAKQMGFELI